MPLSPSRSVLQAALGVARQAARPRSDAELLAAFASRRDEAAFAELVQRHGGLVRGVARRVVGDRDVADDVFQATFLLLARKASATTWGPTVGPWLYQVARRLAAKALSRAGRRPVLASIERDVAGPTRDPAAGLAWAEVRAALDDTLAELPARLRDPLVLCYLQGMTQDEAATALGCSPAAIKGRVARGRERLRQVLARRNLDLSAALAGPLTAEPALTVGVAQATARAAVAFVGNGVASPAVRALLRGTPLAAKLAGTGLAGVVLACVAVVGGMMMGTPDPAFRAAPPVEARKPAMDVFGDPLPAGAVARLGTERMFGFYSPAWAKFSPDGKHVAVHSSRGGIDIWDVATGQRVISRSSYYVIGHAAGWRADGTGIAVLQLPDVTHYVSSFTDSDEKLPNPPALDRNVLPNPYIYHIALSPDATQIAAARGAEKPQFTIDILPATPGRPISALRPLRTLGPFPGPCRDIGYAANGQLFTLHGSETEKGDWSIAFVDPIRNAVTRSVRIPAPGYCPWQYMLGLSHDARLAAISPRTKNSALDYDGTIRIWDLTAGKELRSLAFPQVGYGTGHAFTPDGRRLVTSSRGPYVQVWDLDTGKVLFQVPPTKGRVYHLEAPAVAVSPDGTRIVTARRDGRVDVWDAETGKLTVLLASHREDVDSLTVSPDGRLAATVGVDDSVRVWEIATGKPKAVIPVTRDTDPTTWRFTRRRIAFTPDNRGLLFGSRGELKMADPTTGKPLPLPTGLRGHVGGFSADGLTLATFTANEVTLWDWPAATARVTVAIPMSPHRKRHQKKMEEVVSVNQVALSADGRLLFTNTVCITKDGGAKSCMQNANDVWDARSGKLLHRLTKDQEAGLAPAAFSPDGKILFVGGHGMDFAPVGQTLADALTAWDTASGKVLRRLPDPTPERTKLGGPHIDRQVQSLAVSPDGRLLAITEEPSLDVWLYETASRRILKKLAGHSREVIDLSFTPDGRRLVTGSKDRTCLVWDVTLPTITDARAVTFADAWTRLADADPVLGYAAIAALAAAPEKAMPLLRANLRPAPVPAAADLDRLVRQLDADTFAAREKAAAELDRFGMNAVAGVRERLAGVTSLELRRRLTRFLDAHAGPDPSPHHLLCVRAVAVLEAIGTAEAKALLMQLAKGPAGDVLAREADAARRRGGSP